MAARPRGTPTLSNGRTYTLGATGIVNALNAATGAVVWSRNAASETGTKIPDWGLSSSPLWSTTPSSSRSPAISSLTTSPPAPALDRSRSRVSYSSPHLATIDGVAQVLLLSSEGVASFASADGKLLWEHAWKGYPIVQPAVLPDGNVLISVTEQSGTRRLAATRGAGGWTVQGALDVERPEALLQRLRRSQGHAFGFDGSILAA